MIIHYNLTFSSRTVTYPLISQDHFVQLLFKKKKKEKKDIHHFVKKKTRAQSFKRHLN